MRFTFLIATLLFLAACVSPQQQAQQQAAIAAQPRIALDMGTV
jgi:hypothetical protein